MMSVTVCLALLLAAGTLAAPAAQDERALRELVELLEERVREHQEQNQLLRDNRMVYISDVHTDHIWLVMQKDVRWGPKYTFEVAITDTATGEGWTAQDPITWSELDQSSHDVIDGKFKGYKRAIKITGLKPGHEYRVTETVRTGPGGKEVFTKSKLYTTPRDNSDYDSNSLFGNYGNKRDNRMVYISDVQTDHIWLVMQKDVKWGAGYTFEVAATDTATGVTRTVQSAITWSELDQSSHDVVDGKFKGYKRAVKITGLQAGHEYRVTETVRTGPGGDVVFTKSKIYTTPGSSNSAYNSLFGNTAAERPVLNDADSHSVSQNDCRSFRVCRDGNGAKWEDASGESWYEN